MPSIGARDAASSIASGQAVEGAAGLDHRGGVRLGEGEALVDGAGALGEQRHGAEAERLLGRQRGIGNRERVDAQDALGGEPERRLAGDEQAQPGRALVQRLAERGDAREQVLGVVEREQHGQGRERGDEGGEGVAVTDVDAEGGGERAGQRVGIGDLGQLDPAHALRIGGATGGEEVLRETTTCRGRRCRRR
jgi:hypothetical protein